MKTLENLFALACILTICAVGICASLVGWHELDDACAKAIEENPEQ